LSKGGRRRGYEKRRSKIKGEEKGEKAGKECGGVSHKDRTAAESRKSDRTGERRKKIEDEDQSRKERLVIKNEDADARLTRIVEHMEETAAAARTLTSENAVKAMKNFEEWKTMERSKSKRSTPEAIQYHTC
jgi:hypothetical protein